MRIIVLFNLRAGVDIAAYESWAASVDAPTVRALPSIGGFDVAAMTGLLMGDGQPPFQYIEIIDIADMDQFGQDVATPTMQRVAAEFQTFADNPVFITTRPVA